MGATVSVHPGGTVGNAASEEGVVPKRRSPSLEKLTSALTNLGMTSRSLASAESAFIEHVRAGGTAQTYTNSTAVADKYKAALQVPEAVQALQRVAVATAQSTPSSSSDQAATLSTASTVAATGAALAAGTSTDSPVRAGSSALSGASTAHLAVTTAPLGKEPAAAPAAVQRANSNAALLCKVVADHPGSTAEAAARANVASKLDEAGGWADVAALDQSGDDDSIGEEEGEDYHPDEADPQGMMSARNSFIGHVPADHYMTHDQLKALAESMKHSVDIRDRRFHLTKYKKCFVGDEAVAWLVSSGKCRDKLEAVIIGNMMLKEGFFHHVLLRHVFKDTKLFYRFAGDEYSETDTDEVRTQRSTMMQQTKRSSFIAGAGSGSSKSPRHGAPPNSIPLEVLLRDGEPGPSPKASQTGHSQRSHVRVAVGATSSPLMRDHSLPSCVSPVSSDGASTPCSTVGANAHSNGNSQHSTAGSDAASSPENRPKRQTAIGLSTGNREGLARGTRAGGAAGGGNRSGISSPSNVRCLSRQPSDVNGIGQSSSDLFDLRTLRHVKKGKWRLGPRIGSGSFGTVHKGMNEETGQLVAVKALILPGKASQEDQKAAKELANIEQEVHLLRTMNHPHIVQYLGVDFNAVSNTLYIFSEWVPGGSLRDVLDDFGPLRETVARDYARQVLLGLKYLHDNHIIHRDIKAGNVLIHENGHIKLTDFGASKTLHEEDNAEHTMKGTPYFMAPEVVATGTYGRKADMWSFGGTVLEMVSGQPPWSCLGVKSTLQVYKLLLQTDQTPPLPDTVTPVCRAFMSRCMVRDQDLRPTAEEMLLDPFVNLQPQDLHEQSLRMAGMVDESLQEASLKLNTLQAGAVSSPKTGPGASQNCTVGGGRIVHPNSGTARN